MRNWRFFAVKTVLTRAIDRKSASRFAENARTEGRSEGYEQARLELSQSKSFKIGRGNNGYSQKDVGRYLSNNPPDRAILDARCPYFLSVFSVACGGGSRVKRKRKRRSSSFSAKTVQAGKRAPIPFTMKHRDYLGRVGSQLQRRRPLRNHQTIRNCINAKYALKR